MDYVIGIDVGTSGTKGLLVSLDGKVEASALAEYGMSTPRPGWAEQDPAKWWTAAKQVIAKLAEAAKKSGGAIKAVGLTGQMHSSVFLDKDDKIIRPALLWCDQRTEAECKEITEKTGFDKLIELTANRALTGFTAPKVLWLRNKEPKNYERLTHLLLAKDYIRFMLTHEFATDVSDASGMLLFDVANSKWSGELLDILDIDSAILPGIFESTEITGKVGARAAAETGLAEGTPVMAGGGDQAAGAVGNGIVKEGPALITIGTSGVVFAAAEKPVIDPEARVHSFRHATPGLWHTMEVTLSAGGSIKWLCDTLREIKPDLDYLEMNDLARVVEPGSEGLIFLPYLTGERTPHFDAEARGVFEGLSLKHGLGHMVRSVMEGVAYSLRDSTRLMEEAGAKMDVVYLSGGGAKSDLWTSIMAGVLNMPIKRLSVDEGPSFGAAILALVGSGEFSSTAEAGEKTLSIADETEPEAETVEAYGKGYENFKSLYPALKENFKGT